MRLAVIQDFLRQHDISFRYSEENNAGSIDFQYRGVPYHIWEFPPEEPGCESNLRSGGKVEEFDGDYEAALLALLNEWEL